VERVEVQRRFVTGAVPCEIPDRLFAEGAMPWPAEFQVREAFFQFGRRLRIEVVELLQRPGPHFRAQIGFVPYLPVTDVVTEPVPFSFRVVTDDVRCDVDPFSHVFGRVHEIFVDAVLDRGSQPVIDFRAARDAIRNIVVRLGEIVVVRIFRVRFGIREDQRKIDQSHAGILQRSVV